MSDSDLNKLEKELAALSPSALPSSLVKRIESAVENELAEQVERKVVTFPGANIKPVEDSKNEGRFQWRAAAAVALFGALSAFIVTQPDQGSDHSVLNQPFQVPPSAMDMSSPVFSATDRQGEFTPVSMNRDLTTISDDGIVECSLNQPHHCIRIEYQQKTAYENTQGDIVEVEKPFVDYYVVPVATD